MLFIITESLKQIFLGNRVISSHFGMIRMQTSRHILTALSGLIYSKILRISSATNKKFKKGQINNLVGIHSRRVKMLFMKISDFCNAPFSVIAASYSLYRVIGNIFWYVLGIMIINAGITYLFTKHFMRLYTRAIKIEDKRSNLIAEIIENIKVIKMNSWIACFLNKINETRAKEFYYMAKRTFIRLPHILINNFSQYGLIVLVFWMLISNYNMSISVSSSIAIMRILKRLK